MTTRKAYRTDNLLWAILACCIFAVLGFVDFPGKGENTLWARAQILLTGSYSCSDTDMVTAVGFHALILAAPAAFVAWALQAGAVVCGMRLTGRSDPAQEADYDEKPTAP